MQSYTLDILNLLSYVDMLLDMVNLLSYVYFQWNSNIHTFHLV